MLQINQFFFKIYLSKVVSGLVRFYCMLCITLHKEIFIYYNLVYLKDFIPLIKLHCYNYKS